MQQNELRSKVKVETEINDKLRAQISHMVGHRISGPIATMLGLIELIEMNTCHNGEIRPFVDHLKKCVLKLKDNCKELGDLVYYDIPDDPL